MVLILFFSPLHVGTLTVPPSCDWALSDIFHFQRKTPKCTQASMRHSGRECQHNTATGSLHDRQACIACVEAASYRAIDPNVNHSHITPHLLDLLPMASAGASPQVVDIGCGLAIYHLKIAAFYQGRATHLLVDRSANEVGKKRDYGFAVGGEFAFYNSLECAVEILSANGVPRSQLRAVNASAQGLQDIADDSADVVMSLLSWGYHYPISQYITQAVRMLRPLHGRLLFTPSRWGDPKGQMETLRHAGLGCESLGSFVICCRGCTTRSCAYGARQMGRPMCIYRRETNTVVK